MQTHEQDGWESPPLAAGDAAKPKSDSSEVSIITGEEDLLDDLPYDFGFTAAGHADGEASGSADKDTPSPLETSVKSSSVDSKRRDILRRLKSQLNLDLPNGQDMPFRLLADIERIVLEGYWPSEQSVQKVVPLLMEAIDPATYKDMPAITGLGTDELKRLLTAELELRHAPQAAKLRRHIRKSDKTPPPLPR